MKLVSFTRKNFEQIEPFYRKEGLFKKNKVIISLISVIVLSLIIPIVKATSPCQENRLICHRACHALSAGDPRNGGGCILGCELAYFLCKFFKG
ncbi:MAG: hypothetical protein A3F40_02590 [Chlamydiae bacterium RIFCSPHIGHO2_12_FULL_27_8]|nr:MAG: hypothetical protein A3F40_02590 [Chlamydiae bacterium RIFCSPHIGHO2_12_FULL_27_8]